MKQKIRLGDCYALTKHKRKQTTIRYFSLLAVLTIMCLYAVKQVSAQGEEPAATAVADIKPLQIGDTIPDWLWQKPLHVVNHPGGDDAIMLNDYRGKLIILDFWATWCSPCVAMFPKIASLQVDFREDVQFLPVSYQDEDVVTTFLNQSKHEKQLGLPTVVRDTVMNRVFPHGVIPHYVWIDNQGVVIAITESSSILHENISAILKGHPVSLPSKTDGRLKKYDMNKPMFVSGQHGHSDDALFRSIMLPYIEGLPTGYDFGDVGALGLTKITVSNASILYLYRLAFGAGKTYFGFNKISLDLKDSTLLRPKLKGNAYTDWKRRGNAFCYEIMVPLGQQDMAFDLMQAELRRAFPQYRVSVVPQTRKCLVLSRLPGPDLIKTSGSAPLVEISPYECRMRNVSLGELVGRLDAFYLQNSPYPVVDGTGYTNPVDISFKANMGNVEELNKALSAYGLKFEVEDHNVEILLVENNTPNLKY